MNSSRYFLPVQSRSSPDVLFPAAWYLVEKVSLVEEKDRLWREKDDAID